MDSGSVSSPSQATKRMILLMVIVAVLLAFSRSLPLILGVPGSFHSVLQICLQLVALFAGVIAARALGRNISDDGCGRIVRSMRLLPIRRVVIVAIPVALYALTYLVSLAFSGPAAAATEMLSCLRTLLVCICLFLFEASRRSFD